MLEMKNIRKVYRTEMIETHALEDLSLLVKAGEFVSVTGPSGSGKTTFLNVAGLLDTFDSGTYILSLPAGTYDIVVDSNDNWDIYTPSTITLDEGEDDSLTIYSVDRRSE